MAKKLKGFMLFWAWFVAIVTIFGGLFLLGNAFNLNLLPFLTGGWLTFVLAFSGVLVLLGGVMLIMRSIR